MFYYIEVHLLAYYIQWIKMHGETVKYILGNFSKTYLPKIVLGHYFRVVTNSLCSVLTIRYSLVCFKIIFEVFLKKN
jgi:hypothetical protein